MLATAAERYDELRDDAGLIELRDEIALIRTRITEELDALKATTEDAALVGAIWDRITSLTSEVRKLTEAERRRIKDGQQMMSAERVMETVRAILDVLKENCTPQVCALVAQEIARRTSMPHSAIASRNERRPVRDVQAG